MIPVWIGLGKTTGSNMMPTSHVKPADPNLAIQSDPIINHVQATEIRGYLVQ